MDGGGSRAPRLRSPIPAIQFALERDRIKQGYWQMLQQGAGQLAQRRADATARGERNTMDQQKMEQDQQQHSEKMNADKFYRDAQMEQGDRRIESAEAYRKANLGLREEEMYGGRTESVAAPIPSSRDVSSSVAAGAPSAGFGMPATEQFRPTQRARQDAVRAGDRGRSEERADIRTDLAVDARNRAVAGDSRNFAMNRFKMATQRVKDYAKDHETDAAWLRQHRAEAKADPSLLDTWASDTNGTMNAAQMREFLAMIDEAEDAYAAAKQGPAPGAAAPPSYEEEVDDALAEDDEAALHDSIFEGD